MTSAAEHPGKAPRRFDWARVLPWLCGAIGFAIAAKALAGPDKYGDLGIFLDTAREFRAGGIDLYRARAESGPWAYPHFAVLPYALLQVVLRDDLVVRWVYCALLGAGIAVILRDLLRFVQPFGGLRWWQWLGFGVLFQRCFAQNMSHGQISLFVALFVVRGTLELQRGRDLRAGVLLGIAAALKLTPLLFVVALPLMRRYRAAAAMLATVALAVFVVPWPFCGTEDHLFHLRRLWQTIQGSLAEPGSVPIVELYGGPSIRGTLDYLLQERACDAEGRTVNLVDLSDRGLLAAKLLWSAAILAVLGLWYRRAALLPDPQRLGQQCAAATLAMSFFSPVLRVYHLAAAAPAFVLYCRGPNGRRDLLWWVTSLVLLFTMTLRQHRLLGKTLWRGLEVYGVLHFALVALTVWLWRRSLRDGATIRDTPR
ncbi:MAG: DUF2029 domain-containing protein [Planctomycetes bacterium]|nr:DUF2029 domain-containing protein [Planctomycetota bacterium]